jgi:hypothetical protein
MPVYLVHHSEFGVPQEEIIFIRENNINRIMQYGSLHLGMIVGSVRKASLFYHTEISQRSEFLSAVMSTVAFSSIKNRNFKFTFTPSEIST